MLTFDPLAFKSHLLTSNPRTMCDSPSSQANLDIGWSPLSVGDLRLISEPALGTVEVSPFSLLAFNPSLVLCPHSRSVTRAPALREDLFAAHCVES
jgi:hypothetical protein